MSLILDILSENYPNTITIDELEKKVKEKKKPLLLQGFFVHTPTIDKPIIGGLYQFDGEP